MGTKRRITRSALQDSIYLQHAFEEFINEKEARNLSESTIRNYRESYMEFYKFCEFDKRTTADEVTVQAFYDWIRAMKQSGIKPASINHYLRDCRVFVYWCMAAERKYIAPFKINMVEKQEEQLKIFTDDELRLLLKKPQKNDSFANWRMWAIVNWVLGTGNRASTICEIKMNDIDYTSKEIVLRQTKNKKMQIIPLSPSLEVAVKEYIKLWRGFAEPEDYLFPNIGEEKLTTNALRQSFERYATEREVQRHNIHGLRHNFARGWIRNEGNMFALQKILNHSTLDMTKKYVKIFTEDLKKDYDKFSPLDNIKKDSKRTQVVKRSL